MASVHHQRESATCSGHVIKVKVVTPFLPTLSAVDLTGLVFTVALVGLGCPPASGF